jgi:DNA-binding NarL/FixJ family response regulator
VRAAERLRPDAVVMDVRMPGGGLHATRRIVAARPRTGVLVLALDDDEPVVLAALRAGARGFAAKSADSRRGPARDPRRGRRRHGRHPRR